MKDINKKGRYCSLCKSVKLLLSDDETRTDKFVKIPGYKINIQELVTQMMCLLKKDITTTVPLL